MSLWRVSFCWVTGDLLKTWLGFVFQVRGQRSVTCFVEFGDVASAMAVHQNQQARSTAAAPCTCQLHGNNIFVACMLRTCCGLAVHLLRAALVRCARRQGLQYRAADVAGLPVPAWAQGAVLAGSDRGGIRIQYSKNPFGKKRDAAGNWISMHDAPPLSAAAPVYGGAPYSPAGMASPMQTAVVPIAAPTEGPPGAYTGAPLLPPQAQFAPIVAAPGTDPAAAAAEGGFAMQQAPAVPLEQYAEPKQEPGQQQEQGYDHAQPQMAEAASLANGIPADAGGKGFLNKYPCQVAVSTDADSAT